MRHMFREFRDLGLLLLLLAGCIGGRGPVNPHPVEEPADILFRAARSNWYVRVTDDEGESVDGRVRRETQSTFRIGDRRVSAPDIISIQRLVDAPGLDDWKPFVAAAGVGGLASLFAGFLYSGITDQSYEGATLARWYAAGTVAGVVVILTTGQDRQNRRWVQLWPAPAAPSSH